MLALAALCVAWEAALAPTGRGTLVVKALPLVALLPGLWRAQLRVAKVTTLVVWLYACEGAVRASSDAWPAAGLAALEVALAITAFVFAGMHVRQARRADAQRLPRPPATPRTPAPRASPRRSRRR